MKKLSILLVSFIILFSSCAESRGQETTSIFIEGYFVVENIASSDINDVCIYTPNKKSSVNFYYSCLFCDWKPKIYDSCGKYEIGDTIKLIEEIFR